MRDIIIHYLKKIPIFFSVMRILYIWLHKVYNYFTRYRHRAFRVIHYRKLIDGCLNSKVNIDYNQISIKIEREVLKRTKFELKLTSRWWLLFIRLIDSKKGSSDINKYIIELHNETLSLPFTQNSSFALLELYALLLEYGLYSIGCIIRSQSTKLVLKEGLNKTSNKNILKRYLSAAFEEAKYDELQDPLERLIAIKRDNDEIFLVDLLLHKIIKRKNNKKIIKDEYLDRNYLEIIKGKSVAIVGPSQNDLTNGKEIDTFDVIVRFNYKGENKSPKKYGSRTDISYFNGANTRDLEKNIGKYLLQDLKALVFKVSFKGNKFNCKCVRRMLLPLEHCMLDNSPNALPNMLADLLLYQPQKIKVFSIDMQLSSKRDMSYGVMGASFWDRYYPIAGHDPYSQYKFIEYLYNNNFISVDSKLKAILDLGIVEYMKKLQEVYLDKALYKSN